MSFLLDTNVVSETRKRRPDVVAMGWLRETKADDLFISVLTIGELRRGVERLRRKDASGAGVVDEWLAGLIAIYADRIVPITAEIAQRWGALNVPDPVPAIGGLLAATALVHDWTLVTRNTKDVARTGVRLVDPFES